MIQSKKFSASLHAISAIMWDNAKPTIKVFESIKDTLESMHIFPNKLDRIMAHNKRSSVHTPKQTRASTFTLQKTLQVRDKRRGAGQVRIREEEKEDVERKLGGGGGGGKEYGVRELGEALEEEEEEVGRFEEEEVGRV